MRGEGKVKMKPVTVCATNRITLTISLTRPSCQHQETAEWLRRIAGGKNGGFVWTKGKGLDKM